MTQLIDIKYYKELAERNPEDVCARTSAIYDDEKKCYVLSVWGEDYAIFPYERKIERITENFEPPHEFFYLFIMYYILNLKDIKISNEWISEKDFKGGVTFFRGPHEIPTYLISTRYGDDINAFKKRCEHLGGVPLDMADAAYCFKITSDISVAVLYWLGDDDFPSESKALYDKTAEYLPLDIIFALAVAVCTRVSLCRDFEVSLL